METIKRIAKFEAGALLMLALGVTLLAAADLLFRAAFQPYKLLWREMLTVWVLAFFSGTPFAMLIGTPAYMLLSRRIHSRALSITIAVILTVMSTIAFFFVMASMGPEDGC